MAAAASGRDHCSCRSEVLGEGGCCCRGAGASAHIIARCPMRTLPCTEQDRHRHTNVLNSFLNPFHTERPLPLHCFPREKGCNWYSSATVPEELGRELLPPSSAVGCFSLTVFKLEFFQAFSSTRARAALNARKLVYLLD